MNIRLFKRILTQTFLVPILLLLAVAAALAWQIQSMVAAEGWIDNSDRVTSRIHELERLIIDQETGLRGYQTSGDRFMLAPYQAAALVLPERFETLRNSLADNGEQRGRLAEVSDRYQIWLAFAQDSLAMPIDSARDPALNRRGKQLMDNVRAGTTEMLSAESDLHRQRSSAAHRQVKRVLTIVLIAGAGSGLLIAIFAGSMLRKVSRAYQAAITEAQKQTSEVSESKQWFETTLESIGDGVIACDVDGRVDLMNKVARDLTGWSMEDARGKPLEEVFHIISEESRQLAEDPVSKVRRLHTVVGLANHTVLIRKDGVELALDDSAAPIRDPAGKVIGIVLVFRDITEKRRSENLLIANEKLAVAGRLAASIAHEIHNPLDSVANLHYLLWNETDPGKRNEYLRMAQQELARALQISRAMLSLYREPEAPVPVELKDLIENILLLLERKIGEQHVSVEKQLAVVQISGFPAELRQVFTNLFLNALDAAGPGGRICISLAESPKTARAGAIVEIGDNGAGIDPAIQNKLFEPFSTTKGVNGTGLGLWVSLGIVQKHGGTLELRNSSDENYPGAVVKVFLPARVEAKAIAPAAANAG